MAWLLPTEAKLLWSRPVADLLVGVLEADEGGSEEQVH